LQVAGRPQRAAALYDLYTRREPDTIYRWLRLFDAEGVAGFWPVTMWNQTGSLTRVASLTPLSRKMRT
jgi:hypothetical protein